MIRRFGTMAVIEPFQQDVSRTDDRACFCLDTTGRQLPFSTPSRPFAAGFSVCCLENEAVLDGMRARIAHRPDILDQRRETVEHPFSSIKQWMNQGAFLMRGVGKVRSEFSLTALEGA